MSLELDDRQRAMLLEMGVHVWLPKSAAPALVSGVLEVEVEQAPPIKVLIAPPNPLPMQETPEEGIDRMDWATLSHAIAQCQACQLAKGRRAPVLGNASAIGQRQCDWLVVGDPPDDVEERRGEPFADQVGQLLDNMLKSLGVSRRDTGGAAGACAYVTNVVKCRPSVARNPSAQELLTCEHFLRREVALVQPKVILAMGRFAVQTLLYRSLSDGANAPLGKLRGQIYRYQGIPVVVTYSPVYLLRTQQHKARAWEDLCLALSAM